MQRYENRRAVITGAATGLGRAIAQRLAVERALARGLNPDTPRNLTRSVILP